jgi:hypothetical protein
VEEYSTYYTYALELLRKSDTNEDNLIFIIFYIIISTSSERYHNLICDVKMLSSLILNQFLFLVSTIIDIFLIFLCNSDGSVGMHAVVLLTFLYT